MPHNPLVRGSTPRGGTKNQLLKRQYQLSQYFIASMLPVILGLGEALRATFVPATCTA